MDEGGWEVQNIGKKSPQNAHNNFVMNPFQTAKIQWNHRGRCGGGGWRPQGGIWCFTELWLNEGNLMKFFGTKN